MTAKKSIFSTKNILIASSVAVALVAFGIFRWAKNKQEQTITVFSNLRITPKGIRNVRIANSFLRFNIDLELFNPSNENLYISGYGVVNISRLILYYKQTKLGESNVYLSDIQIQNNRALLLKNIPIEISILNLLSMLPEILDMINELSSMNLNSFLMKVEMNALGEYYTIDVKN